LREYIADLHIHIGSAKGRRVKIAASKDLTLLSILKASATYKGLDMVGIIDSASPPVLEEIEELLSDGTLKELPEGGLKYSPPERLQTPYGELPARDLTLILGEEIEVIYKDKPFHVLIYVPFYRDMRSLSKSLSKHIKNIELSSQKTDLTIGELIELSLSLGGTLIPAHAFTPHKGVYGSATNSLEKLLGEFWEDIPAIELGLSADTFIADLIPELESKTFLSNSDAHSIPKIAREHNIILMEKPTYKELMLALKRREGRKVVKNIGLNPKLGKYHRTFCLNCNKVLSDYPPPVNSCPINPSHKVVKGVLDRIVEIGGRQKPIHPSHRPPYIHQVPLEFLKGLGNKTYYQLIRAFNDEMTIIHRAPIEEIEKVAGSLIAHQIALMRKGKLKLQPGGGGIYGKVVIEQQLTLFKR